MEIGQIPFFPSGEFDGREWFVADCAIRQPVASLWYSAVKWLQREIEHTAALAEHRGNVSLKLKALHELGRVIWLEDRLKRGQQGAGGHNS